MNQTAKQPLLCYHHLPIEISYVVWANLLLVFMFFMPNPAMARHILNDNSAISPLEIPNNLNDDKIRLGERLFHDVRLSSDNSISCESCHHLKTGGADVFPRSFGVSGAEGSINTPTVYNAGLNLAQFWDGRAKTLEDQMDGPIHNPVEMASNWKEVIEKLKSDLNYVDVFSKIYNHDAISETHIKDAISTFERSLVSINSPFDRFLKGDKSALSQEAKQGYERFQALGCISCHQGANIGGNMFQVLGVFNNYFQNRKNISKVDLGRFNVTGLTKDRYTFKVPSLRLVALTAPYFHDGSIKTLPKAVRAMGIYQLGRRLSNEEVRLIVAFLRSLTGELYIGSEK